MSHGDLARQLVEALLGGGVAVDADERAGGPDPVGDEARMAAVAERAVDRDLARLRVEQLDQLAGQDRDVWACHVKKDGQGSLAISTISPGSRPPARSQRSRDPRLEVVEAADQDDVLLDPRVREQRRC